MQINSSILLKGGKEFLYDDFMGHRLRLSRGLPMSFAVSPRPNLRQNKMDDKGEKDEEHEVENFGFACHKPLPGARLIPCSNSCAKHVP